MNKYLTIFLYMILAAAANAEQLPTIFVSILPQKYFVQGIAENSLDIQVMVLPGQSPVTYEPGPQQMVKLSKAKLYFAIGVPFEIKWLPKIKQLYPDLTIIQTDQGIKKRPMHSHRHHHQMDNHNHHIPDPHIWLSPPLTLLQARNIFTALINLYPQKRTFFTKNYHQFISQIVALDTELMHILSQYRHKTFMVFHPSWGYFADAYGWHQIPIETEGKDVKPSQLAHLIDSAKSNEIKVIFAQPQFSSKSANLISKSIGGKLIMIDPLSVNWAENLKNVARKMVKQ
jgi:zinc transport system substrate-binding protein